jgi:hypothetical protein
MRESDDLSELIGVHAAKVGRLRGWRASTYKHGPTEGYVIGDLYKFRVVRSSPNFWVVYDYDQTVNISQSQWELLVWLEDNL